MDIGEEESDMGLVDDTKDNSVRNSFSLQDNSVRNELGQGEATIAAMRRQRKITSKSAARLVEENPSRNTSQGEQSFQGCEGMKQECEGRSHVGGAADGCGTKPSCGPTKIPPQNSDHLKVPGREKELQPNPQNDNKDLLYCPWCSVSFLQLDDLNGHVRMAHTEKYMELTDNSLVLSFNYLRLLTCRPTQERSSVDEAMETSEVAGDEPYTCGVCGHGCDSSKGLLDHRRTHILEKTYMCIDCDDGFDILNDLLDHRRVAHKREYTCDVCGKVFQSHPYSERHKKLHTAEKTFLCEVCGKGFAALELLNRHKQKHMTEEHKRRQSLVHTGELLPTGEIPHMCDVCGKQFMYRTSLRYHQLTSHAGEKPFQCDLCDKRFCLKLLLTSHKKSHKGNEQFICDVCGEMFSYKRCLESHQTKHTGVKPYKCEPCGCTFSHRQTLRDHIRKHTGEKLLKCIYCGMEFVQKYSLREHIRTHTGEKPFTCEVCGLGFAQNSTLQKHKRTHRGEKPETEVCS